MNDTQNPSLKDIPAVIYCLIFSGFVTSCQIGPVPTILPFIGNISIPSADADVASPLSVHRPFLLDQTEICGRLSATS